MKEIPCRKSQRKEYNVKNSREEDSFRNYLVTLPGKTAVYPLKKQERPGQNTSGTDKSISENAALKKQVEAFRQQTVDRTAKTLAEHAQKVNGVKVVKAVLPVDPASAKDIVFKVREQIPESLVCVLGSHHDNRPLLSVMFSDDMVKDHNLNAGKLIREAAKLIQGGGGGQPHYAQAGGKNVDGLSAAVDKIIELIEL